MTTDTIKTKTIKGKGTPTGLKTEVQFDYEVFESGEVPSFEALRRFLDNREIPDDGPEGLIINATGGIAWSDEDSDEDDSEEKTRGKREVPLAKNVMFIRYLKTYNQSKARSAAFSAATDTEEAQLAKFNSNANDIMRKASVTPEVRRRLELITKWNSGTLTQAEQEELLTLAASVQAK